MYYDSGDNRLYFYNDTAWIPITKVTNYTTDSIASGDFMIFSDESESEDPTNKITIDNLAAFLAGGTGLSASSGVISVGTLNQNTTGSAATLTTARDIGGVSFNGSASIDLPGVNTAGNQNTTGTATYATNVKVTHGNVSDTTCFIPFVTAGATANYGLNTEAGLTYNATDNSLATTTFVGDLTGDVTGNADTATKIASITNSDIVQLAGSQTLTGTKTLNSFKGTGSVTVTNILDEDAMGSDSATALATQQSIKAYVDANTGGSVTSLGTITQDTVTFTSANADDPLFIIQNTTADASGPRLRFVMDKGAAGAADDECGTIEFYGDDASQDQVLFSEIKSQVAVHTNGQEGGKLSLGVATHDGEMQYGLVLTDGSAEDEIDVTIGSGSSSVTTIAGDLTVTGTTTTVNSTTVDVADININLGNGVGADTAVDGGGITLESTDSNKTFNWVNATDAWTSNQGIDVTSGNVYKIAGTQVLGGTTLGSTIVTSSLTSVGTIGTGVWNGDAIASSYIAADAITGAKIADNAIDSEHYTDGSIDNAHIADDAIDSEHYAAGSIDTAHIANDQITNALMADDAIDSAQLVAGSVDAAHMSANSIDSASYVDGSIDTAHFAAGAVDAAAMGANSVDSSELVDGSVDASHLAADCVTAAKIGDDVIDSEHYAAGSIDNEHLAANSVDSANYVDGSIDTAHYAAGSVDATALGADCVTAAKIGDNVINSEHYAAASIDNEHLADDAVNSDEIAAGAIDAAHMSANSIDSASYVDGSIDTAHYAAGSVDTTALGADSVTGAKIADDAIDSEHYAAGSIDTAHIADDQITLAKMAPSAIGVTATIVVGSMSTNKRVQIKHDLDTQDIIVQMWDVVTFANVHADILRAEDDLTSTSDDYITVDFGEITPPNNIRVLITSFEGATNIAAGVSTIVYT